MAAEHIQFPWAHIHPRSNRNQGGLLVDIMAQAFIHDSGATKLPALPAHAKYATPDGALTLARGALQWNGNFGQDEVDDTAIILPLTTAMPCGRSNIQPERNKSDATPLLATCCALYWQ